MESLEKGVSVTLSAAQIQITVQSTFRDKFKEHKDDVNGALLSNGVLSCNYVKDGKVAYNVNLCDCDEISISRSANPTLCFEFNKNQYHLIFTKKALMNEWYDKTVEILNLHGFEFDMNLNKKLKRKVASQRIVRPKASIRRKKGVSSVGNLNGYAEGSSSRCEYQYADAPRPMGEEAIRTGAQCSEESEIYTTCIYADNKQVPSQFHSKDGQGESKHSKLERLQPETSSVNEHTYSDISNTNSDDARNCIASKNLDYNNTFRKRSNRILTNYKDIENKTSKLVHNNKYMQSLRSQLKQTIIVKVNKSDLEGNVVFKMIEGVLFVSWLKRGLSTVFEGDIIRFINNQRIESVEDALKTIEKIGKDPVELEIFRLPYAEIVTINRPSVDVRNLGFKLENRKVCSVEEGGLADLAGLRVQTVKAMKFGGQTRTCVTAINDRPLGHQCTDEEIIELLSVYKDFASLVVQPLDLIACLQQEVDFPDNI